ncbi:MAG: WD40-repeat-containing domain protein [Benniella sp.]|nr:MAG: WD40-repeat-containing domain protein [Benniella sp.]
MFKEPTTTPTKPSQNMETSEHPSCDICTALKAGKMFKCSTLFDSIAPSPRGDLSLQQSLELANIYLEGANRAKDADITLVLCHEAEIALTQAGKRTRHVEDPVLREEIAGAYISLGQVLNGQGHAKEAEASYKTAEKCGKSSTGTLLQDLETNGNIKDKERLQMCRKNGSYPLKLPLPSLSSPSLLDRVQNKLDVEGPIRRPKKYRLEEQRDDIFIPLQGKASLQASEDKGFPLMEKVQEFLRGDQNVFLLLGDSGAGKTTFNLQLECNLWNNYTKANGRIPLFITLSAIDKPEQDMIGKHLRRSGFTEPEIRELKESREFILICDGYDESQQTHNLYESNRLSHKGEWKAKMVIGCRSEYLGAGYQDLFRPSDHRNPEEGRFQEAVITPFTTDQIHGYIEKYTLKNQLWKASKYEQALAVIPSLKEPVRNPFLLSLTLEVLPRMVGPGENFSAIQNGVDFLKELAVAIYKNQGGQPIVKYSRSKDEGSWKTEFFGREGEKQLLRQACPLTRTGTQHRLVHRSLLEYGMVLAIYDPHDWIEANVKHVSSRRGSTSSAYSFVVDDTTEEEDFTSVEHVPDINSPLAGKYFINHPRAAVPEREVPAGANVQETVIRLYRALEDGRNYKMQVNLRGTWLQSADLSRAQMSGVQFGELPLDNGEVRVYSTSTWQLTRTLTGHDGHVQTVTHSPEGGQIASGGLDGTLRLWEAELGTCTHTMIGHKGTLNSVAYSPRGDTVVFARDDATIRLWDLASGGGGDHAVRLWDVETGACLRILYGHSSLIWAVVFSPQRDRVFSGDCDHTVWIWNVESGTPCGELMGHSDDVRAVVCSLQGDVIATASVDKTVRLWDTETESCRQILRGHSTVSQPAITTGIEFSQGDQVASCGDDGSFRYWDVETGICSRNLSIRMQDAKITVCSPRGSRDQTVQLWDAASGQYRASQTFNSPVSCIAWSTRPDASCLVIGCEDGVVRMWGVVEEEEVCHIRLRWGTMNGALVVKDASYSGCT